MIRVLRPMPSGTRTYTATTWAVTRGGSLRILGPDPLTADADGQAGQERQDDDSDTDSTLVLIAEFPDGHWTGVELADPND